MSSQGFLGAAPIMEGSSIPPFRLATALLETAAGMAGILRSSEASRRAANKARKRKADTFFIAGILRLPAELGKIEPRPYAQPYSASVIRLGPAVLHE